MKKLLSVVIILLFASSAYGQNWFQGKFNDALQKSKKEGKAVLINFSSST